MTVKKKKECRHCLRHYIYQASGPGIGSFNNDRYCPRCFELIQKALAEVKPVVTYEWLPASEYTPGITLAQLIQWRNESIDQMIEDKGFYLEQVSAPLFRLDDHGNVTERQETGVVTGKGTYHEMAFRYRYWKGHEDEAEIFVKVKHTNESP